MEVLAVASLESAYVLDAHNSLVASKGFLVDALQVNASAQDAHNLPAAASYQLTVNG